MITNFFKPQRSGGVGKAPAPHVSPQDGPGPSSKKTTAIPATPADSASSQRQRRQDAHTGSCCKATENATTLPASPPAHSPPPAATASPSPHREVTIKPVRATHLPALQRMATALLPVKYSRAHHAAAVDDPTVASISRVAVYRAGGAAADGTVVGSIKCALQPAVSSAAASPATNLYIETLVLQAPFRGYGIARAMLEALLYSRPRGQKQDETPGADDSELVSDTVRHYNIRTVSAHVHEANHHALQWYQAQGFTVQPVTIDGYYRTLRPTGAKLVVKALDWQP